jgi:ankyrin repeat protein
MQQDVEPQSSKLALKGHIRARSRRLFVDSITSRGGSREIVQRLLGCFADANAQAIDGWTLLDMAAFGEHLNVEELLLKHGGGLPGTKMVRQRSRWHRTEITRGLRECYQQRAI